MDQATRLATLLRMNRSRQCVLFVGAGYSLGAKCRSEDGRLSDLVDARGLVSLLKDSLKEDNEELGELAELYQDEHGEHGLFKLLSSLFVVTSVTPTQKAILGYRWKEVYTTNYDNVLQTSCTELGVRYSTYSTSKRPSDVDHRTLPLIHVNGMVAGATFRDFRSEIKLTNTQYYTDDFSRSPWGSRFRNDIITSPCIVFAGYSLYDLDVARILHSFEGMQERIFFVMKDRPSRASERKLLQFGQIVTIGTEGLAKIISEIDTADDKPTSANLSAWNKIQLPTTSKSVRDIDVTNFLMSGNVAESQFASDVIEQQYKIAINRTATDQIVDLVGKGLLNGAILTSNIGNGKTTALEAIAYKLCSRGLNVYRAGAYKPLLLKEIALLRQIEGRIYLLIDDAFTNIEVIRALRAVGRDDICIISSARTSQYELQEGELKDAFANQVETFNLDRLDDRETDALIEHLDNYALWGERQSASRDKKIHFIRLDCSRELRSVILETLDSPNIRDRISELIRFEGEATLQDRIRSVIVISQLLNLAETRADLSLIGEMLQIDARNTILTHERRLRDFSLIQNGRISMRSSILSEYLLKRLLDTGFVIDVMTKCMINLDLIYDDDDLYKDTFKKFSRFRFVETAIATEKRLIHMVKYFEDIKELAHCREQSLFWLQYAMCRLSLNQYKEAARIFDVAFSYSKKSGYRENRHLNNQFARFLLESRTNSDEYTDYMIAFNRAHAICVKQMHDEPNSYNPYRVAQNYFKFVDRRIAQLTQGDLVSIFRSCSEVTQFIVRRTANRHISSSRVVEDCAKSMKEAMDRARKKLREFDVDI
ncbi:SIR2 family protein [Rhodopseudomonas sp. BR0M22]|uniref:SIR2 family protein n=1 Tax=Rhodopseudomonas sp. BR0M22 TaxID=2269369 RepID=UPI0013E0E7D0|nr:SIR2 family protein [Rhodopseudomonas sp. BR0M22]NEW94647.1 hypothetical protein [Rhodopseudomonas sp. BR0M22]